jgi:hypothetical protein
MELVAAGTDGVVASASPWRLTSAGNDFGVRGVAAGHVLIIERAATGTLWNKANDVLEVHAPSGNNVDLKRLQFDAQGEGMPPFAGDASGVTFRIRSARSQIQKATALLDERYGITSRTDTLYPNTLTQACVAWVLWKLYGPQSRTYGNEREDDFAAKARAYKAEFDALDEELASFYGPGQHVRRPVAATLDEPDARPLVGIWPYQCPRGYPWPAPPCR